MNANSVRTECAHCNKCCKCKQLKDFFFVTLDYKGNIVVISDYAEYPTVEVDPKDALITFHAPDVTDFTKPDTKLIYQNGIY